MATPERKQNGEASSVGFRNTAASGLLQLWISVPVDLAILLSQILIDLVLLDLGGRGGPRDQGG